MLVALPNKQISEHWDTFKEVIRKSLPTSPIMLPDRMNRMLQAALLGRLQLWFLYDDIAKEDEFYGAMITKICEDDLTGEKSLLIYAFYNWKKPNRESRDKDAQALIRIAKAMGCNYITAYCGSKLVAETMLKGFGNGEIINYAMVSTGE